MLMEFTVGNFHSFRDPQTLSLVASSDKRHLGTHTIKLPKSREPRILRSAVIYGPNAAGKSNLVVALEFMRQFILTSASHGQEGDRIDVVPFLLDAQSSDEPSEFEVVFIHGGVRYQYGFAVTQTRVVHEWLLVYVHSKAQRWFERWYDEESAREEWSFSPSFRGRKKLLTDTTRKNALFLSTAIQLNNEKLQPVFTWFLRKLRIIRAHDNISHSLRNLSIELCKNDNTREEIVEFLSSADLGIDDIRIDSESISQALQFDQTDRLAKYSFASRQRGREREIAKFLHKKIDSSELIPFTLNQESDGTQRIFELAGHWLTAGKNGHVLVIDELEVRLHPLLAKHLVKLFHDEQFNQGNAQLITTTHNTALMDHELLRRDQLWFVAKPKKASKLMPLTEFQPRRGEAIERGYLRGKYGAIPFVGRQTS